MKDLATDIHAAARLDFWAFVELTFPVLHGGKDLVFAPYMDVLACVLESCARREKRRIIVNLPPRHLKSMLISILYVAWRLGQDPGLKFICVSYGDDLAHALSVKTRTLMQSDIYRTIFPGTVLEKKAEDHLMTTAGGYRYATSVGSDITGFGADEIIVDDPMQPEDASSEIAKQKIRDWVQSSVLTRFDSPNEGVFILVMHRLAPDDLAGTLGSTGNYFTLSLPLVAEEYECFENSGVDIMERHPGDVLNPAYMSKAEVKKLKQELAPHVWDSQYQQRPTGNSSGLLSLDKLHRFDKAPKFELIIHSWDIGATVEGNPTVCTKWGLAKNEKGQDVLYLIELIKLKVELPDVRAAIKGQDKLDKPELIIVDAVGAGLGTYQDLRQSGYAHLMPRTETESSAGKMTRFGLALPHLYDGLGLFPESAPWLDDFFYELTAFPNGKHDDQVDSMTQLIAYFERAVKQARRKLRPKKL
jgi:predicted phage terminase large subunit-like protein